MRLESPVEGTIVDASNAPLLTPKFWVHATYTELLHAASRYRAVREQEEKRPTTGLVKVLCLPYMTGKHVSFMKEKSFPPQAMRLCLAVLAGPAHCRFRYSSAEQSRAELQVEALAC